MANKYDMESILGAGSTQANDASKPKSKYNMDSLFGAKSDEAMAIDSRAKTNITEAVKKDPLQVFKGQMFATELGIPPDVAHRNLPEVEANAKAKQWESALQTSPTLKKMMADPYFAGVSAKDESLPEVEKLFREKGFYAASELRRKTQDISMAERQATYKSWGRDLQTWQGDMAWIGEAALRWSAGSIQRLPVNIGAEVAGGISAVPAPQLGLVSPFLSLLRPFMPAAEQFLLQESKRSREEEAAAIGPAPESVMGNAAYQAVRSVSQNLIPMAIGVVTAQPELALGVMTGEVAGEEYVAGREAGMSPAKATTFSIAKAVPEYFTEKIPMADLFKNLRIGKDFAGTFLNNQIREQVGEQIATLTQDAVDWAYLNPDKTLKEFLAERPEAAMQTALVTLMAGGGQVAIAKAIETAGNFISTKEEKAAYAVQNSKAMENLYNLANNSTLKGIDAKSFENLVQTLADDNDGSPSELYVDGKTLAQLLEQSNIDVSTMPSVADQLQNAINTESDVLVPLGEMTAALSNTGVEAQIIENLKFEQDGPTVAEARKILADTTEFFKLEVDKTIVTEQDKTDWQEKTNVVYENILEQITKTKRYSKEVNDLMANFVANYYSVQATNRSAFSGQRVTPDMLFNEKPLTIVGESPITGEVLAQAAPFKQTESAEFKSWSNDAPLISSTAADTHGFKSGTAVVVESYHGTKRPDRVGTKFKKSRATSGPMSFFTSSPALASSYAQNKRDTSVDYEDTMYENWFLIKVQGYRNPVSIDRAWYSLDPEVRNTVAERMKDIRLDDETGENIIYEKGGGDIGSYQYELQQTQRGWDKRGNPLKAAVETWLTSGSLFGQEERFMEVLKLAGMPMKDVTYNDPHAEYPFVYKTYIRMNNPLVTSDIPESVENAMREAAKKDRSRAKGGSSDMWDKNNRTLREWVDMYFSEPDNAYVWTSIPDKVTALFKSLGYDGIVDWSGKSGATEAAPVYIPFEENQVKSAIGNKGDFSEKAGLLNQDQAPIFYSALYNGIDTAKLKDMPASQWKAWLTSNASKLSIKKEEIEWTGLNEYFDLRGKDKLSKQDVLEYLANNGVVVEERNLGITASEDQLAYDAVKKYVDQRGFEFDDRGVDGYSYVIDPETNETIAEGYIQDIGNYFGLEVEEFEGATKFSEWQLDGGTNYRELLLKIPPTEITDISYRVVSPDGTSSIYWSKDVAETLVRDEGGTIEEIKKPAITGFRGKHWSDLNVVAHVRFNDRVDADGKRILFIEEIQSDWAQEGRKKGFGEGVTIKYIPEIDAYKAFDFEGKSIDLRYKGERYTALNSEEAVREALKSSSYKKGVPEGPYLKETKSWTALAVKRMMRYAADNGYDKVAFINGTQSADRYNLAKQVEYIDWYPLTMQEDGGFYNGRIVTIQPHEGDAIELQVDRNGKVIDIGSQFEDKGLDEIIGKDAADKIMAGESGSLRGDGLKVGGEGMVAYYDQIVPSVVNEQLKKVGGGKLSNLNFIDKPQGIEVSVKQLENGRWLLTRPYGGSELPANRFASEQDAYDYNMNLAIEEEKNRSRNEIGNNQLGFEVTDAMREQILKGLPLFQGVNGKALGTFDPDQFIITLKQGANLSTFFHEVGHFFLEMQVNAATQDNAPDQIRKDVDTLMQWFGTDLGTWQRMSLDQKRDFHEKFARGFEAYILEGKSPSVEMTGAFQRFRSWLSHVYNSLQQFLGTYNVELTKEVRQVMDRMIATEEQIRAAKVRNNLTALFTTADESQMTDDEFFEYQIAVTAATEDAIDAMNIRSLRDIKYLRRARDKAVRQFQKDGQEKRREVRMEARAQVMSQPVYRAWSFLTGYDWGKVSAKPKTDKTLDPSKDSLFTAIEKSGGINRALAISEFGIDPVDAKKYPRVFRKEGGMGVDGMAETLSQFGYITTDENGKYDLSDFEDSLMQELMGDPYYSIAYDYTQDIPEFVIGEQVDLAKQLPAGRLNTADVKAILGGRFEENRAKLSRMLASDGLMPDAIAELFANEDGSQAFTSGRDLIEQILNAAPPSEAIESLTDKIVLERYGDITSEKAAQEAADEALHNEAMLRSAATEMKALTGMQGSARQLARAAKDAAISAIGKTKVKDLRPQKYVTAAAKASKNADDAIKRKDLKAAAEYKRLQMLNLAMVQRAYEAESKIRKTMDEFAKLNRADKKLAKRYDINLIDTARSVLASFGLNNSDPREAMDNLDKVKAYNPELYAVLEPVVRAATNAARDEKGNPVNYKQLSIDDFFGLHDTVAQLTHQASSEKQVTVNGIKIDLEDANRQLLEQMAIAGIQPVEIGKSQAPTEKDQRRWTLSSLKGSLRRMEHWVDAQDLGNFQGAFRKFLFQGINDGATKYRTAKNRLLKQYKEMLEAKSKEGDFINTKILASEFGYSFNGKQELLGAMLHTGNDSNKRKLLVGRGWGALVEGADKKKTLDSKSWDSFINRMISEGTLTKSDFDFLQATWDMMESVKADSQKAHFQLYGYYFDEITNTPFTNQFGTYRGGYAPAKADTDLVLEADMRASVNELENDFNFLMPSTGSGFTKGRVEYNKPLVMDLRLVAQHLDQVLRFTYIQPAISDVLKIVKRGEFANTLNAVDKGALKDMIYPFLQRAATQTTSTPFTSAGGKIFGKFCSYLRRQSGMQIMMANTVNALQQMTGLSLTAVKVEPRYIKSALVRYTKAPNETASAIALQSEWMANRLDGQSFEMQQAIEEIMIGESIYGKSKDWIQRHAYFMQRAMQNIVDCVSWSAAYDKAISENMDEDLAVKYADSVVRETQSSLLPEDISTMEAGNAFMQLFTQFMNYFNMQANLLGSAFTKTYRELGVKNGMGRMFYIYAMGFMIPSLLADAIVRTFGWDWDDEDDDGYLDEFMAWFFGSQARSATAMIPVAGQLTIAAANKFNGKFYDDRISTSPTIGMLDTVVDAPVAIYKAIYDDGSVKRAIKDSLTAIAVFSGIPVTALGRPAGYIADYAEGKVEPANALDFIRGVVSGRGREEERQ